MAATMIDNLQGDLTLLGSAFESLQIAISDALTPTLREFAQFGQKAMANLLEGFHGGGVSGFMNALSSIVTDGVAMLAQKAPEFVSVSGQFIAAFVEGILHSRSAIMNSANEILIMFGDGLRSWLSSNKESLNSFGNELIRVIFQGFLTAGDIISENIGQFIPLLINAFATYHEALFTVGIEILGAIGRGIVENQEEIQTIASDAIKSMVTALRENAPAIIEGGIALIEALAGAIMENMPLILETGAEIVGQLVSGITSSLPAFAVAILPIITHIGKIIDTVGKIKDVVKTVVDFVAGSNGIGKIIEIGKTLMSGIQALFGLIMAHPVVAVVTAIIAAIVLLWTQCEEFRDAVGAIWEAIKGFFVGAWEGIQTAWNGAGEFFGSIVNGIKGVFDGIGEFLGGLFRNAWEGIKTAWEGATEFFGSIWENIKEGAGVVGETVGAALKGAKEFFGGIWENVKEKGGEAAENVKSAFEKGWDGIKTAWNGSKDFFSEKWEEIRNVFGNAWDKFSEVGGNIVKGIKDGIKGAWDSFSGWVGEKFEGFVGGVKTKLKIHSPSQVFAEIGEFMMLGLKSGVDGETNAVNTQMVKIVSTMKDAFSGMANIFSDIGRNAMNALSGSLGNAIQSLKNKVTDLMNSIANAARKALGIHSPSRVFAGIGENMALGLAEGWDDQYGSIKRQIENGMNFSPVSVGVKTSGISVSPETRAPQMSAAGNTFNFTFQSPKALDPVSAAREARKAAQQIALGYV